MSAVGILNAEVGYLGPEGTYSQKAALRYLDERGSFVRKAVRGRNGSGEDGELFPRDPEEGRLRNEKRIDVASGSEPNAEAGEDETADLLPCATIPEICRGVDEGRLVLGILPLENSLYGSVPLTLDLLLEKENLEIVDEIVIPIRHCLLARKHVEGLEQITRVYSHPQALAQCRQFLERRLAHAESVEVDSTSAAAREVCESEEKLAAIGAETAAEYYGLQILRQEIQDSDENFTRFVVIGRSGKALGGQREYPDARWKTSIVFSMPDRPGALYEILGHFARRGVNLTRIESRPAKRRLGKYIFYIDFTGHTAEARIRDILAELEDLLSFLRILGSYPAYPLPE